MPIRQGYADQPAAKDAIHRLRERIWQDEMALVVFFASPDYDRHEIEKAISAEFPGINVIGCTTAGEITGEGYREGTITGISFDARYFRANSVLVGGLQDFRMEDGEHVARRLVDGLGLPLPTSRTAPSQAFSMMLIDGLSSQEELVVASVSSFLDPIPLFGGSAGDGLNFGSTWIFHGGKFHRDAAVLTIFQTSCPFHVFKLDHFSPTAGKMVVTEADPHSRRVMEIDAETAAPAYARMLGISESELSPHVFAAYPVVVRIAGEYHVRSIQKVEPDGSLRFYCGIDEGLVLTVANGNDIAENLERSMLELREKIGEVKAIIGFDCILRRLEAEQKQKTHQVSEVLRQNKIVGFSTYGEQFRSMHVNQTFTGVMIGAPREGVAESQK